MGLNALFLGYGRMGAALGEAWLAAGLVDGIDAVDPLRAQDVKARIYRQAADLPATRYDLVVMAVKPAMAREALSALPASQLEKATVMSVMAGVSIDTLRAALPVQRPVVRSMPNTPVMVRQGCVGLYAGNDVSSTLRDTLTRLLNAVGRAFWVQNEDQLHAVTAISGSGPAYYHLFSEALADAAVQLGLPRDLARQLAAQTALGAATLQAQEGADFAELAKKYSSFGSAENGGDLGWLTEASLTQANLGKDFDREVFSAPINQPTLVKTNNGYHLLKVTERTAAVSKYKVAVVYMDVRPTNKTYSKIFNDLNAFVAKNKTADQIAAAAKENGYELTPDVTVTGEDHQLGMIQDARQVVRWAFENKSKGKVSDIKECKSRIPGTSDYKTTYVVAILRDVLKEGYQSFETVAPLIRRELAMRKKSEDVAASLKAKNLTSLQAYASAMNSRIDTVKFITMNTARINGIGLEPILNAYVAYAKPNTLSGPVAGYNGVYVFQVYNRTKDATPYNEKAQMREIEANTAPRVGYFALQKLVEDSKITDNRIRFE